MATRRSGDDTPNLANHPTDPGSAIPFVDPGSGAQHVLATAAAPAEGQSHVDEYELSEIEEARRDANFERLQAEVDALKSQLAGAPKDRAGLPMGDAVTVSGTSGTPTIVAVPSDEYRRRQSLAENARAMADTRRNTGPAVFGLRDAFGSLVFVDGNGYEVDEPEGFSEDFAY